MGEAQSIFAEAVWANKAGTEPQLKNLLRPKLFQFRSDTSPPLHWTPLEFHVFPQQNCSNIYYPATADRRRRKEGYSSKTLPRPFLLRTRGVWKKSCIMTGNTSARNTCCLRTILRDYSIVSPDSCLLP